MLRYFPKADAYFASANRPDIAVSDLFVLGAPDFLRGKTLLFASDFHLRPKMDPACILAPMLSIHADLILLGGDFSDTRDQALRLFDAFRALRAPMGIFAVCGNNDSEAFGDHSTLADALNIFGAQLLVNRSISLHLPGGNLHIGGLDEPRHGHPNCTNLFPNADGYRILLSHYPILPSESAAPHLMLAGHTHGGQFNCLGLNPYSIGFERFGHKKHLAAAMVSGSRSFGPTTLLVSKGIGASRIPLRIGVRPEIHRISFC